jgi:ASC-1-like (ASCH) protein
MTERTHKLKTWPSYFEAVLHGGKTFEIRLNDRDFAVGDWLILEEWIPPVSLDELSPKEYTGRKLKKLVTYVMQGGRFGLDQHWCVLGLSELGEFSK